MENEYRIQCKMQGETTWGALAMFNDGNQAETAEWVKSLRINNPDAAYRVQYRNHGKTHWVISKSSIFNS